MRCERMQQNDPTCLDRQRHGAGFVDELIGNRGLNLRTMRQHALFGAWNYLQATVADGGVRHGDPDCDHFRAVRLCVTDTAILMPVGSGNMRPRFVGRECGRRRFDAYMLDRIGGNLRPDQRLHDVQYLVTAHEIEDRRAKMHRRVVPDTVAGQADVHGLKPVAASRVADAQLVPEAKASRVDGDFSFAPPPLV